MQGALKECIVTDASEQVNADQSSQASQPSQTQTSSSSSSPAAGSASGSSRSGAARSGASAGMPKRSTKSRGRVTRGAGAAGADVPVVFSASPTKPAPEAAPAQESAVASAAPSASGSGQGGASSQQKSPQDSPDRGERQSRLDRLASELFVDKGVTSPAAKPQSPAKVAPSIRASSSSRASSAKSAPSSFLFSAPSVEERAANIVLPPAKPMTSLLFQEPVLPAAPRRSAEESLDELDQALDQSTGRRRKRRPAESDHDRRQDRDHDRDHGRDHDSEREPALPSSRRRFKANVEDLDSVFENAFDEVEERRSNRRLNAQERRAAAEVELIEEDLEDDDIEYRPIVDEGDYEDGESREDEDQTQEEEDDSRVRRRRHGRNSPRDARDSRGSGRSGSGDEESRDEEDEEESGTRTRCRRRNRSGSSSGPGSSASSSSSNHEDEDEEPTTTRRRRRRRGHGATDEEEEIPRSRKQQYIDKITGIEGSTRLEAKRQRRRDNRRERNHHGLITEQDFLARREKVDRLMVVREHGRHSQVSVIEDNVLVEHYISDIDEVASVGNIYQGRVQNVLPSMEAAFVDIGQHRNGVLYAGEVNWDATRLEGQPRLVEHAFRPGDNVLVQVTKDPIGHKGARLTSQITVAGRYLVLVPSGGITGVSRKLPDCERTRLKNIVSTISPDNMGVIIRTAAEGVGEDALKRDMEHLVRQWQSVQDNLKKYESSKRPHLLLGEPDVVIRVIRDIFNDDFNKLIVEGDGVYDRIARYLEVAAPDLKDRLEKWDPEEHEGKDVFDRWSIDSQLRKGMERKVYLPSGGSLVIDRTEAMTTIDVNTGRFIGKGQSLEETVTKCNLEAAEEIVRQLRLRDIGGMIMIDFVDMVMPQNRDLVLRRLVECLSRDRTKHQVAEVTSLGLVQMTRKRVGQGLVEAFSEECPTCGGRGFILHDEPTVSSKFDDPYALKGGDPFIHTNKHGMGHAGAGEEIEGNAPQGSTPQVKATLARIAAAAEAAEADKTEEDSDGTVEDSSSGKAGKPGTGTREPGTQEADTQEED